MASKGAKYLQLALEEITTIFAASFSAACAITSAYAEALKFSSLSLETLNTFEAPYLPNWSV